MKYNNPTIFFSKILNTEDWPLMCNLYLIKMENLNLTKNPYVSHLNWML